MSSAPSSARWPPPTRRWRRGRSSTARDREHRALEVGRRLLAALQPPAARRPRSRPLARLPDAVLRRPLPSRAPSPSPDDASYDQELERLQGRLALLSRRKRFARHAVVVVFEGMDAAGKGGAIRRITAALDARQYRVVPVSAPTPEELAHPYLWRFWRQLPPRAQYTIFDRSWYGRVLVERVRGFARPDDWRRAYAEINEFERQLLEHRVVVAKFWMSVGKAEQLERFAERDSDPLKRFKVDPEDWANRKLWNPYQAAAREMIARTSTPEAPWIMVPADDKRHARLDGPARAAGPHRDGPRMSREQALPHVALVSAREALALDEDLPPLAEALRRAGARVATPCWDDPQVDWSTFDVAVLRSTWDYVERIVEFRQWARRCAAQTRLFNPPEVVEWNTDKHYLQHLHGAGVAVVPTRFVEPGEDPALALQSFLHGGDGSLSAGRESAVRPVRGQAHGRRGLARHRALPQ